MMTQQFKQGYALLIAVDQNKALRVRRCRMSAKTLPLCVRSSFILIAAPTRPRMSVCYRALRARETVY